MAMIWILAAAALANGQSPPTGAALERLKASNEAKGMAAAKEGMARGGYGFSPVATPYGLYIMAVAPGSRAASSGLRSGDDVLLINGRSTIGMGLDQAMAIVHADPSGGLDFKTADGRLVHLPPLVPQVQPTTSVVATQMASNAAPSVEGGQGCIGATLDSCIAHMRASMRIDDDRIKAQLSRAAETDVNGKPLGGARVLVGSAYYGESSFPQILTIRRDSTGNVADVELSLRGNPMIARSADEYADTGLGVAFRAVLPPSCTANGDMAAFKFFENVVKPSIKIGKKDVTIDETHASSDRMSQSPAVPYCGVRVQFSHLGGYDTDNIDEDNEHGAYSFSTIAFSRGSPADGHRLAARK
jgi:hypothetical protein